MKRLFEVNGEFFGNKAEAKVARGEPVTKAEGKKPATYKAEIRRGPDHWLAGGPVPGSAAAAPAPVKRVRKSKAAS